ncbi:hypothetical protein LX77_02942 [Gelidibacter algens]|uniref:Uncharacterized protein n=1 Tax=Gelidibacter algens TaxID=49280 RepID=A0A1A7R749_9FLAO|nr:hypothetical protein [Gelidibacter algens]OBX27299.1 hypothetical protein A9996_00865 [Gelidibacter algens]RAJ20948.1 hypothetical protein LX77_02942 [Gelidibacter algens]
MLTKRKSKPQMPFSKSKILPIIGLVTLLFFITISYFENHVFFDKLITCSLILGMVYFARTLGESNENEPSSDI